MGLLSTIGGLAGGFFGGPVGATIGGALGGAIDDDQKQDRAEDFTQASAQANRDFQERMSNTAWQRGMADMRAAGLNPMLAVSQGPASVPGGAQAQWPGAVGAQYIQAEASASSAQAALQQADTAERIGDSTILKIKQEITNMVSVEKQVAAVTDNLRVEYQNLIKQGYNLTEVGNQIRQTIDKMRAEIPLISEQTFLAEAERKLKQAQTSLANLDIQAADRVDNVGRTAGQLRIFIDLLRVLTKGN